MNNHAEVRVKVPRELWEQWHRWLSKNGLKQSNVIRGMMREVIYGERCLSGLERECEQ